MKLKFYNPNDFKKRKKRKPASKLKIYKTALQEACSQLVLEGNYNNYTSAYNSVIKKAKQKITNERKSSPL